MFRNTLGAGGALALAAMLVGCAGPTPGSDLAPRTATIQRTASSQSS